MKKPRENKLNFQAWSLLVCVRDNFGSEGWEFKSLRARQYFVNLEVLWPSII